MNSRLLHLMPRKPLLQLSDKELLALVASIFQVSAPHRQRFAVAHGLPFEKAITKTTKVYRSTQEEIEGVPMTTGAAYTYWTAYALSVPNLAATNVVQLMGDYEINNPNNFAAQVTQIIGRDTGFGISSPIGVDTAFPLNGSDVVPYGHYRDMELAVDQAQTGDREYSLYLETASTAAFPGAAVALNPGYGGLVAIVT